MSTQLRLIDTTTPAWRLDEQTKATGREGIAAARDALRNSHPRYSAPAQNAA